MLGEGVPRRLAQHRLAGLGELLQALAEVDGVADERVLDPLFAAEQGGGDRAGAEPDARARTACSPSAIHSSLTACWARCIARAAANARSAWSSVRDGCAEHGHHGVADVLHHGAALAEDGPVHLGAVAVELLGQHDRVGVLGDRRVATDVAHHDGHVEPLRLPDRPPAGEQLLGDSRRQQTAQGLALLLALDDRLVQPAQPVERARLPARHALGEVDEQALDAVVDGAGVVFSTRRSP